MRCTKRSLVINLDLFWKQVSSYYTSSEILEFCYKLIKRLSLILTKEAPNKLERFQQIQLEEFLKSSKINILLMYLNYFLVILTLNIAQVLVEQITIL